MGETIPQIDRNPEFFSFFFPKGTVLFQPASWRAGVILVGGWHKYMYSIRDISGYVMYVYMMMYYIYTLDLFNHIVKVQTHYYIHGYRLMNACLLPLCEPVRQTGLRAHTQTSTKVYKFS